MVLLHLFFSFFLPMLADPISLPSSSFSVLTKDYITDTASISIKKLNDTTTLSTISYITLLYEDQSTQTITKDTLSQNTFTYIDNSLQIQLYLSSGNSTFSICSLTSDTDEYLTDIQFNFIFNGMLNYNKWTNETFTKSNERLFTFYFNTLPLFPIYLLESLKDEYTLPTSCSFNDTLLRAQCKYSLSSLPQKNIRSFIIKNEVYYETSPKANIDLYFYSFMPSCEVVNKSTNVEISLTSSDIDISNYILNVGSNIYNALYSSQLMMNFTFDSSDFNVGSHSIKISDSTQKNLPMDSQSMKIINVYDIESIEPNILSLPYFRVTFVYTFDFDVKKSYQIRQNEMNTTIKCTLVGNTGIDCEIPKQFHFYQDGSAFVDIGVYTCKNSNLEIISNEISLLSVDIFRTEFSFDFPDYPIVGKENVFTLSTEYLYYIENITEITFKVINYKGEEVELKYTKNDKKFNFTFNKDEYNITLNLTYRPGDYIELISIKDTVNTLSFQQGQHVFKHSFPFVFICPPLIEAVDYTCEIMSAKWSNVDINSLSSISLSDKENNTLVYTVTNEILIQNDKALLTLHFTQIDDSFIIKEISLNDGPQYTNDNISFLYFAIDRLDLTANELQFGNQKEFNIFASFTNDAILLINNEFAVPCIEIENSIKKCKVELNSYETQLIDDFILIFHYIYIITNKQIEIANYELSLNKKCLNKIDTLTEVSFTIKTFTENKLNDYEMYLNSDETKIAETTKINETAYQYTFTKDKLQNGLYDSFYLKNSNGDLYFISHTEFFYYVDNSIIDISYPNITFNSNETNQRAEFQFMNEISYISSIKLIDTDSDVDDNKKENYAITPCTKESSNNSLICSFDMTNYYGYDYRVAFISQCDSVEFLTNKIIRTLQIETFLTVNYEYFYIDSVIAVIITPKIAIEANEVKLINVDDNSIITIDNYTISKKENLTFIAPSIQGEFILSITIDGTVVQYQTIKIIAHLIELQCNKIFLPNEDKSIDTVIIPLKEKILIDQIEYIKYDSNEIDSYKLSDDNMNIVILFSDANIYNDIGEHYISIKDKVQSDEIIYTIAIVSKPIFSIEQSLFIQGSTNKRINVNVDNIGTLIIENIYIKEGDSYTALNGNYEIVIDTSINKEILLAYKIGNYYYDIQQKIIVSNLHHNELIKEIKECNFITNKQFSIDLSLLISNTPIDNDLIAIKVNDENGNEIEFIRNALSYEYINENIEMGLYHYKMFYGEDTLSFFEGSFTLTFFDNSRTAYNLLSEPFTIDFTEMLCDINISHLNLKSSIDIALNCEYQNNDLKLNCLLDNSSEIELLTESNYIIMNSTEQFHSISLLRCDKPNNKINSVNKICLSKCPIDFPFIFNGECVSKCPSNSSVINSFCIDTIVIESQTESIITIKGDLSQIQFLIKDYIQDFIQLNKTILGDDFAIQIFPLGSPIENEDASSIKTQQIENAIRDAMNLSLSDPLYIIKIDSYLKNEITSNVDFSILTQNGIEINKDIYENTYIEISYPINEDILNLSIASSFAEEGIDVFNAGDTFFNDICYPYATENGTDIIISDRRKDLFQNISFCAEGCTYKGIDYTTKKVKCECNAKEEEKRNDFTDEIFESNIIVVKCYKTLLKIEPTNIGLISCSLFFIIMIIFTFYFVNKDFHRLMSLLNKKFISAPPVTDNQTTEISSYEVTEKTFIENRRLSIIFYEPVKVETMVIGAPQDLGNYPYKNAKQSDHRSLCEMFCSLYLDKEEITRICCPSSKYECFSISINYFIFNLSLNFAMNAIFFSDEQLSMRYKNGSLSFFQDLLRSIPSDIISFFFGLICKQLISYVALIEVLLVEAKTDQFNLLMQKLYSKIKLKFIMFHTLLFLVVTFSLYYLTLFCIIYKSSQLSWFIGCIYSILISVIVNIVICFLISLLRKLSISFNALYAYNISLFFKRMI